MLKHKQNYAKSLLLQSLVFINHPLLTKLDDINIIMIYNYNKIRQFDFQRNYIQFILY
jgi:hypothetical protein